MTAAKNQHARETRWQRILVHAPPWHPTSDQSKLTYRLILAIDERLRVPLNPESNGVAEINVPDMGRTHAAQPVFLDAHAASVQLRYRRIFYVASST